MARRRKAHVNAAGEELDWQEMDDAEKRAVVGNAFAYAYKVQAKYHAEQAAKQAKGKTP